MDGRTRARLTIGQFARMTQLSATTLRHYHAVGLLAPAAVDPVTGYRHYTVDQVADAHVVRRLRDLDMPIDEVRAVLQRADPAARNAVIATHLAAMEQRLRATTDAVASLRRELLTAPVDVLDLQYRTVAATPVWAITADVGHEVIHEWASRSLRRLVTAVGRDHRTAPPGVLYDPPFFEDGSGRVMAFVPTARTDPPPPIGATVLPAAELAVGLHRGRLADLDRSYGAIGRVVTEQGIAIDGPIREHFLGRDPSRSPGRSTSRGRRPDHVRAGISQAWSSSMRWWRIGLACAPADHDGNTDE